MITKMTGQTAVFAMSSGIRSAVFGLGLNTCAASVVRGSVVSGLGNDEGTRVETGLSLDWAALGGGLAALNGRPTQAPKAAEAAAHHGSYVSVIGAGAAKKQDEQQISKMRAFRGPEPWRERT
jgi:hypothetical protein